MSDNRDNRQVTEKYCLPATKDQYEAFTVIRNV